METLLLFTCDCALLIDQRYSRLLVSSHTSQHLHFRRRIWQYPTLHSMFSYIVVEQLASVGLFFIKSNVFIEAKLYLNFYVAVATTF